MTDTTRTAQDGSLAHARHGARRVFDLSPPLSPAIGVWPGDTPLTREVLCDIERGANITLSTLRTTVHVGSHADGPNHYGAGASDIASMDLAHYLGPCTVLRTRAMEGGSSRDRGEGQRVGASDIEGGLDRALMPRVLIATGTFPDPRAWDSAFAGLDPALIDALARRGVITIGVDTPSVDPQDSKDMPAHKAMLRTGIAILEGLALASVPAGDYELIALPLRLVGFDASPVRAVLRELA
jgi:arylformamidase